MSNVAQVSGVLLSNQVSQHQVKCTSTL